MIYCIKGLGNELGTLTGHDDHRGPRVQALALQSFFVLLGKKIRNLQILWENNALVSLT